MAASIKHIVLLLCFLLLCFLSARTTEGRRLSVKYPEKVEPPRVHEVNPKHVEKHDDLRRAEGDEVLVGMDYTPAYRKSPVHN